MKKAQSGQMDAWEHFRAPTVVQSGQNGRLNGFFAVPALRAGALRKYTKFTHVGPENPLFPAEPISS
jgi:hypothetical protein